MANKTKFGFGAKGNVDSAVKEGQLDSFDVIITTDTKELAYVAKDGTVHYLNGRMATFESMDDATAYIATDVAYVGQIVTVYEDDAYVPYVVVSSDDGNILVKINSDDAISSAKQEAVDEAKAYVEEQLTVVEF